MKLCTSKIYYPYILISTKRRKKP